MSMINGNGISFLLIIVNFPWPATPWTISVPISMCYDENKSDGSTTLIIDSRTFFCPPRGIIVITMLN